MTILSLPQFVLSLMAEHSAIQAVAVIAIIIAIGTALAKLRIGGVSLGVACVFFVGILAGHLGFSLDPEVLLYVETFGLVIFVYALGLQVGPGFFNSLRHDGMKLNMWGLALIAVGTLMAILCWEFSPIGLPEMMGIYCGATTNTPALGAAQQTLSQFGLSGGGAALGCAITYPLGVVGVILAMIILKKIFVRGVEVPKTSHYTSDDTFVARFDVVNPGVNGKTLKEIVEMSHLKFIISRVWRGDEVLVPHSSTILFEGDSILVVTTKHEVSALEILFGRRSTEDWNKEEIDWNKVDRQVESRTIVLSSPGLNGKRLGHLHLGSTYGVNISRVTRGDIRLLATYDLQLQYGDRLTAVGEAKDLDNAAKFLGNAVQNLNEPNLGSIFLGILLGLGLGSIPVSLPGMSVPVKLGMAGGPIIVGILAGAFGPSFHIITFTTRSANLMLRKLGLSLYLACLGLDSGPQFFQTVVRPEGLLWLGMGLALTVMPVVIVGAIIIKLRRFDFGTVCGILCGSMANPMALGYANDAARSDAPSLSYATVYPLCMFVRVVVVQIVLIALL